MDFFYYFSGFFSKSTFHCLLSGRATFSTRGNPWASRIEKVQVGSYFCECFSVATLSNEDDNLNTDDPNKALGKH